MEKCKRRKANIYDLLDLIICTSIQIQEIQKNTENTGNEKEGKQIFMTCLTQLPAGRPGATYDA